jgi:hypothetical protein
MMVVASDGETTQDKGMQFDGGMCEKSGDGERE